MADIATLGIEIKSSGAEEASRKLSELEQAAQKAASSTDNLGEQSKQTSDAVQELGETSEQTGGFFSSMTAEIAKGVAVERLVEGGIRMVIGAMRDGIVAAANYEMAVTKMASSLRTVGNATGQTIDQLKAFAARLETSSMESEESILRMIQILNRSGAVTAQNFEQVTRLALDMAAAMGTDGVQAAELLSKAMIDPANGVTLLRRSFPDLTKAMAENIAKLAEMGDKAGATAALMKALSGVNGEATAATDTTAGAFFRLSDAIGDALRDGAAYYLKMVDAKGIMNDLTHVIVGTAVEQDALTSLQREAQAQTDVLTSKTNALSGASNTYQGQAKGAAGATDSAAGSARNAVGAWNSYGQSVIGAANALSIYQQVANEKQGLPKWFDWSLVMKASEESAARATAAAVVAKREQQAAGEAMSKFTDEMTKQSVAVERSAQMQAAKSRSEKVAIQESIELEKLRQQAASDGVKVDAALEAKMKALAHATAEANVPLERAAAAHHSHATGIDKTAKAADRLNDELTKLVLREQMDADMVGKSVLARELATNALRIEEIALRQNISLNDKRLQQTKEQLDQATKLKASRQWASDQQEINDKLREEIAVMGLEGAARDNAVDRIETEREARAQLGDSVDGNVMAYERERETLRNMKEMHEKEAQLAQDEMGAFTDFATSVIDGSENIGQAIGKLIIKLVELELQMRLTAATGGGLGGGGGSGILGGLFNFLGFGGGGGTASGTDFLESWAVARGGVFSGGNIIPFARGGTVDRPTMRSMALMGEAGPEAVLPLRRDSSGNLGVASGGEASSPKVIVQNIDQRKNGANLETEQTKGQNGEIVIRTYIRDEVKRAISDGSFDKDLSKNFNLGRNPTRRS